MTETTIRPIVEAFYQGLRRAGHRARRCRSSPTTSTGWCRGRSTSSRSSASGTARPRCWKAIARSRAGSQVTGYQVETLLVDGDRAAALIRLTSDRARDRQGHERADLAVLALPRRQDRRDARRARQLRHGRADARPLARPGARSTRELSRRATDQRDDFCCAVRSNNCARHARSGLMHAIESGRRLRTDQPDRRDRHSGAARPAAVGPLPHARRRGARHHVDPRRARGHARRHGRGRAEGRARCCSSAMPMSALPAARISPARCSARSSSAG